MTLRSLSPRDPFAQLHAPTDDAPSAGRPRPQDIVAAGRRLRAALADDPSQHLDLIAQACQRAIARALPRIAARGEFSAPLLDASLDALVRPFLSVAELQNFARTLRPRRELVGFIMPANVPGAGLHELVAALLAGCAAIVKTATREPVFFDELAQALAHLEGRGAQPSLAARIAIFTWDRSRRDLTDALERTCDRMVVLGSDDTLARIRTAPDASPNPGGETPIAGFGSRVSAAVVTRELAADDAAHAKLADALARDVSLFDQRGCLSPLHIFVEDGEPARAAAFAARLADAMDRFAAAMPPPLSLALEDAAAIRRARESARWRALGGQPVQLWEGARLAWTVIYDREAEFSMSPGFRTVYVSPFADLPDLERRLAPVNGRLEACALAATNARMALTRALIERAGATYICEPGRMQSPPIDWPHGGGAFVRMLMGDA